MAFKSYGTACMDLHPLDLADTSEVKFFIDRTAGGKPALPTWRKRLLLGFQKQY